MASTKTASSGGSRARRVRKTAAPRNRSEEFLNRGSSAWDSPNRKLNPNTSYWRTLLKRERGLRWYIRLTFWLALPLFIVSALLYIQSLNQESLNLEETSVPANSSAGKETAFAELTSWLNDEFSPLPGAQIVSWDGYTVEEAPEPTKKSDERLPYRFETHRFTLAQGPSAYQATVQVAVSDVLGAVATSTPSYMPIPQTDELAGGAPVAWFGLAPAPVPDSVQPAVDDWVTALTSGDSDTLRRAVGDPNGSHVYLPLTGVDEIVEVKIVAASYLPDPKAADDAEISEHNLGMIARVEVTLWWEGQERPGRESTSDRPAPVTFDVLIENPGTATPLVKAWGPTGSGPDLKAYENAVTGVDADALTGNRPTPAPAPAPTDDVDADGLETEPTPSPSPTDKDGDS